MSRWRAGVTVMSVPIAAAAATLGVVLATGVHRRLGATKAEAFATLPGDDLLPDAEIQNDRARTVPASTEAVWPWIAQLGQDKAGFYSFEFLENLAGCQINGASTIHPEWQDVKPGDVFRLHPEVAVRVAQVDPGRALVLTSKGGEAPGETGFDITWAMTLVPMISESGEHATRLHFRERYATDRPSMRPTIELTSVISALMTWRMMARIGELSSTVDV